MTRKPVTIIAKSSICGVWSNIAKAIKYLPEFDINYHELFSLILGWNLSILLWKYYWCGSLTLQECFPRLYDLETVKLCLVSNKIIRLGFQWS